MSSKLRYQRVLLKISGEALKGKQEYGYDPAAVDAAVARIAEARDRKSTRLNSSHGY